VQSSRSTATAVAVARLERAAQRRHSGRLEQAEDTVSESVRHAEVAAAQLKAALTSSDPPPHFGLDALLASVDTGAVAPLRGSWLIACHERGEQLRRRQDLPTEAFMDPGTLRSLAVALGADYGLLFVALSYRWLTSAHPDPDGYTLKIVADACKLYLDENPDISPLSAAFIAHGIPLVADCAVFWDFGSLFQNPRSAAEQVLFVPGLKSSNVWYGHEMSVCWMQTSLPAGFAFPAHLAQTYDESGWLRRSCHLRGRQDGHASSGPRAAHVGAARIRRSLAVGRAAGPRLRSTAAAAADPRHSPSPARACQDFHFRRFKHGPNAGPRHLPLR